MISFLEEKFHQNDHQNELVLSNTLERPPITYRCTFEIRVGKNSSCHTTRGCNSWNKKWRNETQKKEFARKKGMTYKDKGKNSD